MIQQVVACVCCVFTVCSRRCAVLIVLVLGAVLQDACELHVVEVGLLVDGRLPEELIHLLVGEAVAHRGQQLPQVVLLDEA